MFVYNDPEHILTLNIFSWSAETEPPRSAHRDQLDTVT